MTFSKRRQQIKLKKTFTIGFGASILLSNIIPAINILIMLMTVAGGTPF